MHPQRRKELCVATAILALCILCTAAALTSNTRSEVLELSSVAITTLVFSWFLAANERVRIEGRELRKITATDMPLFQTMSITKTSKTTATPREEIEPVNAFSIDLEDYFHTEVASKTIAYSDWAGLPSRLENTVPRLLDLLDETNTRATVFVLGWIAEKYPSLVRQIAERGHEIACHSYQHRAVFKMNSKSFYEDTYKAKDLIESVAGCTVTGYRAPCFSIVTGTEWAFDVLSELGFSYDSSVNPIYHGFYGNPHSLHVPHYVGQDGLLEIPIAVWRVGGLNLPVGGGAYLRLLPYAYSLAGLRYLNRIEKRPVTLYMHPWELDHHQPNLRLAMLPRIRQTWGTHAMEGRLRGILQEFRFASLGEVYAPWLLPSKNVPSHDPRSMGIAVEALS